MTISQNITKMNSTVLTGHFPIHSGSSKAFTFTFNKMQNKAHNTSFKFRCHHGSKLLSQHLNSSLLLHSKSSLQNFFKLNAVTASPISDVLNIWKYKTQSPIDIRLINLSQLKEVSEVIAKGFFEPGPIEFINDLQYGFFKAEVFDLVSAKLRLNPIDRFSCIIAMENNKLIGHIEVSLQDDIKVLKKIGHEHGHEDIYAYISSMAVLPKFRGKGIGTALLSAAEFVAFYWGHKHTYLHVFRDNVIARSLYRNNGYEEIFRESDWLPLFGKKQRILMKHDISHLNI